MLTYPEYRARRIADAAAGIERPIPRYRVTPHGLVLNDRTSRRQHEREQEKRIARPFTEQLKRWIASGYWYGPRFVLT